MTQSREQLLFIVLGVVAVLAALSRTDKGASVAASVTDTIAAVARGLRNNNPGNVREAPGGGDAWRGERATDDDTAFEEFAEMKWGVRAALVVFRNYQTRYGLRTVAELIARWAPPVENDTASYVASVAKRVGVAPNVPIDLRNRDTAFDFLRAVFRHENGVAAELIPAATIYQGIEAAV